MRSPDVVAVRVNDDATAVYRVDVPATSGTEAEAQATRPAFVAGGALGLDIEVVDVTAVADEERIAAFRRWASSG